MNKAKVIAALLLVNVSCHLGEPQNGGSITSDFRLRDLHGNEVNRFRSGEEFYMHLTLTNTTGQTQEFSYGGPIVFFEIRVRDSLVCTSVDGLAFPHVVERGEMEAGETFRYDWRAPDSPALPGRILLQPGEYVARVLIGYGFDRFGVLPPKELNFIVLS